MVAVVCRVLGIPLRITSSHSDSALSPPTTTRWLASQGYRVPSRTSSPRSDRLASTQKSPAEDSGKRDLRGEEATTKKKYLGSCFVIPASFIASSNHSPPTDSSGEYKRVKRMNDRSTPLIKKEPRTQHPHPHPGSDIQPAPAEPAEQPTRNNKTNIRGACSPGNSGSHRIFIFIALLLSRLPLLKLHTFWRTKPWMGAR